MKNFIITLIILLSFNAHSSQKKGQEIAQKMDKANEGFVGERAETDLILIDANGTMITREMAGMSKEEKDVTKSLLTFEKPADVKGTKLLTWSFEEEGKDDNQWLYLPSIRRVKKINSKTRGSSFMGSEFSYEDLTSQPIEKYHYNFIKDSKLNGEDIWILDRTAKKSGSYKKVTLYVSKSKLSVVKSDYYNRRGELLKVATFKSFKTFKVNGKTFYRPSEIEMANKLNKKKSIFKWKTRNLGVKLSDSELHKRSLK